MASPAAPAARASEVCEDVGTAEQAISNKNSESEIETTENAVKAFSCDLCDFSSNWENGLKVHMTRKHAKLDQLDGNISFVSDDEEYSRTKLYWKTGRLTSTYQNFLDANKIVENSELSEEIKTIEKEKILEARKIEFGKFFRNVPPWS